MSICASGPGASRQPLPAPVEPDATHFRKGDVWMSPRGMLYRVIKVEKHIATLCRGIKVQKHVATLRLGINGTGRKIVREWDAIGSFSGSQWIRESWGGAE